MVVVGGGRVTLTFGCYRARTMDGGEKATLTCLQDLGLFCFSLKFRISPRERQTGRTYLSFIGVPSVARNAYS